RFPILTRHVAGFRFHAARQLRPPVQRFAMSAGGDRPLDGRLRLGRGCRMASRTNEQAMISEKVAPVLVARTLGPFDLIGILVANFLQQFATFFTCNGQPCTILTKNWEMGIVVLVVVWFSASMSYLKMRVTQNYVNVQFWAYASVIFLIGLSGVIWLLKG